MSQYADLCDELLAIFKMSPWQDPTNPATRAVAAIYALSAENARAEFTPFTPSNYVLDLLQDGHITVSKAREWLNDYITAGVEGPLPDRETKGPSTWDQITQLERELRDTQRTLAACNEVLQDERDAALKRVDELDDECERWESAVVEAAAERNRLRTRCEALEAALDNLLNVVGLTAFKHESQRSVLQEAWDAGRAAIAAQEVGK